MSMLSDYKKKLRTYNMGKKSPSPGFRVWKFKSLPAAQKKVKVMKKMYGYTPSVLAVKHKQTGKVLQYSVVEPKYMARVDE